MTRRGIREMKHKRILFGDLQYTPTQNPYAPQGIRKMSEVWVDPSGDGYVSMVPGYSLLDDLDGVSKPVKKRLMMLPKVEGLFFLPAISADVTRLMKISLR